MTNKKQSSLNSDSETNRQIVDGTRFFSRVINFLTEWEIVSEIDLRTPSGWPSSAASTDLAPWEEEPEGEGVTIPCSLSGLKG